jgi:hypothetical protein
MKKIFAIATLCAAVALVSCKQDIDDPAPTATKPSFAFSGKTLSVNKGGSATFTVKRGGDMFNGTVTLSAIAIDTVSPAGASDYAITPSVVNFTENATEAVVTITTPENDGAATGNKRFGIVMSGASVGSDAVALTADTLKVSIVDINTATLAMASVEPIELVEGGEAYEVSILRTGADWAGSVKLSLSTEGYANPATFGTDFTISGVPVTFASGETEKKITITPRAADGAFTGNVKFDLKIASAANAAIAEDAAAVSVTVKEASTFESYFVGTWYWWGVPLDSMETQGFKSYEVAVSKVDSVTYDLVFSAWGGDPLRVNVDENFGLSIKLPQYLATQSDYYIRYASWLIDGGNLVGFGDDYTLTATFGSFSWGGYGFTFAEGRGLAIPVYNKPDYVDESIVTFIECLIDGTMMLEKN